MFSELISVFIWWFTLFIFGISVLPLTTRLFSRFADRGYAFAKVLGIAIVSYLLFLLAHLKLIALTQPTILAVLALVAGVNFLFRFKLGKQNFQWTKPELGSLNWKTNLLVILEEWIFAAGLLFWSVIRGFAPEIHGLEKFMDFGFVNSVLAGKTLPPLDMWLTHAPDYPNYFINYYYFGHYVTALLTRLSGLDSAITYNLMLATIFAFCFTLSFSLGLNLFYGWLKSLSSEEPRLSKPILVGLVAAFLVTFAGNLHTIYTWYQAYSNEQPKPFWQLGAGCNVGTNDCFSLIPLVGSFPNSYWYPNATRFIPFTIHEFPIYSFVVSDLHGHVLDIPFVLLTLALLLTFIIDNGEQNSKHEARSTKQYQNSNKQNPKQFRLWNFASLNSFRISMPVRFASLKLLRSGQAGNFEFRILLLGLLLAIMYMTNAWDGIIYLILSGLVLLYGNIANLGKEQNNPENNTDPKETLHWYPLTRTVWQGLLVVVAFAIFTLPFSRNFQPFVHGIGVVGGWEMINGILQTANSFGLLQTAASTFAAQTVVHTGPFLLEKGNNVRSPIWMMAILWGFFYYNVIGFLAFIILPVIKKLRTSATVLKPKLIKAQMNSNIQAMRVYPRLIRVLRGLPPTDIFVLLTIIVSTILLVFPEFFYIKDIYPAHYRANTMFKLGYQAFMMLSLACAYIFFRVLMNKVPAVEGLSRFKFSLRESPKVLWLFGFLVGFFLVGIYPYFAIMSYYGNLKFYKGFNGLTWLGIQYADDYQAIEWLRNQIAQCKLTEPVSTTEQMFPLLPPPATQDRLRALRADCHQSPVILEAVGESYTDFARVSANTGLPTVVGWPVHEWLWRGNYDEAGKRIPLVEKMYTSKNTAEVQGLLDKYHVAYVFVGTLERQKYPALTEEVFKQLGQVVFQSGETRIYKISY